VDRVCRGEYREQAEDLCARTLRLLGRDLEKTGTLHEYYNPFTGEPVMNGDFVNWNVLALNMADELRGKPSMEDLLA
jgi:putative isomerase